VDTLKSAVRDHWVRFDGSLEEEYREVERLKSAIRDKLEYALVLDSTCLQAYLGLGDYALSGMFYEDSLINVAKHWYGLGLQYLPTNDDLLARLGFVYETEGSLDSARLLLGKVATDTLGFMNTEQALVQLETSKNLKQEFFQAPEESYLLLERKATYARDDSPVAYLRLQATGKCELYDYYDDMRIPIKVERHLDSASVDSVIGTLQSASFFTMQNPLKSQQDWAADFDYVRQWHLPLYRITLHLPSINHTICVYGLGLLCGHNALANVPSVTYLRQLNIPPESTVMNRLDSLSTMWARLFNFDWLAKSIDEEFGRYRPIESGPGTYRYDSATDEFVRIAIPERRKQWVTSRATRQTAEQDLAGWNVVFYVGDSIYTLDGRTGNFIYALSRDSLEFPYFNIYSGHMYFGRMTSTAYMLRDHEFMNGKYLYTVECQGNPEVWFKTDGRKVDKYHKSSISAQFEQLISFYSINGSRR